MSNILRVVFSFALVFAAVWLASLFISPSASSWYASLIKPPFTPPNWIFSLVWLIVYVLMAFALARVWTKKETGQWRMWFFTFGVQLLFNILWSLLFFGLQGLFLSSCATIILWFAILILTLNSYEIGRLTFWLLIPYFAWSTFLVFLNVALWWLN